MTTRPTSALLALLLASNAMAAGTKSINMPGSIAGGVEMQVIGRPGKTFTTNPDSETDLFIVKLFEGKGEVEVRLNGTAYIAQEANLVVVDRTGCRVSLYSHLIGHDCPRH